MKNDRYSSKYKSIASSQVLVTDPEPKMATEPLKN
jgi:hypothetical protein